MIILVVGTNNSGKSKLAEDTICSLSSENERIYLATMIAYDEDGKNRIIKHRQQREGKGFVTLEIPYGITKALKQIEEPESKSILLECMSNLVGNEMYENKRNDDKSLEQIMAKIVSDVNELATKVKNLIIVTNKFEQSKDMDLETWLYIKATDMVNEELIKLADKVEYV